MKYGRRRCRALLLVIFVLLPGAIFPFVAVRAQENGLNNRFNVVIVMDASNSVNYTDPSGLRYEAVNLFTNLLAEEGNYLGGVVFANHVEASQSPKLVSSQRDKEKVSDMLASFMSHGVSNETGYTNIGEGLGEAVDMLVNDGNPELPSVIVFFSDGNTEMPSNEEYDTSLDRKAEAIQRARDNDISIYSMCLNANEKADSSEMRQISSATGGEFQEIFNAEDLQDVFNSFYDLIYGTSTIILMDDVFPAEGEIGTDFDIPGIGVEEVNIIIYGKASDVTLYEPDGTESVVNVISSDTFTMIKLTNVIPGTWSLAAKGNPGDPIKVNMVYNTDLEVLISGEVEDVVNPADAVAVEAYLKAGTIVADRDSQYEGYTAELQITDGYGDDVETVPMTVNEGHFETGCYLEEGTYYICAVVSGNNLEKKSDLLGPVIVSSEALTEEEKNNTAPVPAENPVEELITIWPFRDNSYTLDMTTLATDEQDEELRYKILSSSFIEGEDYTVDGDTLTISKYSLSKGAFTISATDSGGLSCEIEVIIQSVNVGILTLIGLGIAILIGILIVAINIWYWTRKPFRGDIKAQSYCNGSYKGTTRTKRRGRIKLSAFGMEPVGLNYNKSYFQATGQQYVYLITDRPVIWNGQKTSKIRIQSGAEVILTVSEKDSRMLFIRFDSRMKGRAGGVHRRTKARR